jgi:3-oxoisoapionate kinase
MAQALIGFYGDDFTGSSENLAQLHRRGLRTRLFLRPLPFDKLSEAARDLHVIGFAGTTRALSVEKIKEELSLVFPLLQRLGPRFLQYKICSTFDSSPTIGSYGAAMASARAFFADCAFAILPAVLDFGRYTAFGQQFARFGADIVRLDRHPSMASHPKTPMDEADLRLHLARQTSLPFANVFLPMLHSKGQARNAMLEAFDHGEGVIFDSVDNDDLARVAALLWDASADRRVFALAAQGLAQGLGDLVAEQTPADERIQVRTQIPAADRLLVLSGSCALQTGRQIDFVERQGWATAHLDPAHIDNAEARDAAVASLVTEALTAIAAGRPMVIYTARGVVGRAGGEGEVSALALGEAFALIARQVRQKLALPRIVFAGGDSSSYSVRALKADALDIDVFDAEESSHLCKLISEDPTVDGLEVMLKGGQVGTDEYLRYAMTGRRS